VVSRLAGQRRDERVGDVEAGPLQPPRELAGVDAAGGDVVQRGGGQEWLAHHVDEHRAGRQADLAELGDRVDGLLHRHLLEQRDEVDRRTARAQQVHHAVRLLPHRPHASEPGDLAVDVEEPRDPAGRRGVEHDRVVEPAAAAPLPGRCLHDLAGEQHIAQTRGDRRREVDCAELLQRRARAAQVVEHLEVLQQRRLGIHRKRIDLAAADPGRDPPLLVGQRRGVEQLCDALAALDLRQQDMPSL